MIFFPFFYGFTYMGEREYKDRTNSENIRPHLDASTTLHTSIITQPLLKIYALIHSLHAANSLGSLSSVWAGPFTRQLIGYIGDDQNLKFRDPFYDNREFTNPYLSRLYGNKKLVVGVDIGNGLFD